jgi:predicted polyphosphate/ATP-dependent NAD kinase
VAVETTLERAEELAERLLPDRTPKRRMLVIVNPYATTVSDRLRNLVVYALQSRYSVEAIDTQERNHATQLCREAAREGYDVVVAFGGDGTVNEAANGLVGSDTPLTALPGGSTNVWARTLGIPNDVVDATEHLLRMADEWVPRRVDVGRVGDRHFVFASGVGLDASVVERVDAHPYRKARFGAWYYSLAGVSIFNRRYLVNPPRVRADARRRDFSRPELGPLHLLPRAPDPGGRAGRAGDGLACGGRAEERDAARAADAGPAAGVRKGAERDAPPAGGVAAGA